MTCTKCSFPNIPMSPCGRMLCPMCCAACRRGNGGKCPDVENAVIEREAATQRERRERSGKYTGLR